MKVVIKGEVTVETEEDEIVHIITALTKGRARAKQLGAQLKRVREERSR